MTLRPWEQRGPRTHLAALAPAGEQGVSVQQGLIWHLEPLGLGGKGGSSPTPLQGVGSGAQAESSGSLKLKSQDTSVTENRGELSALPIGSIEPMGAEASTSPSYRWDTAGGIIMEGPCHHLSLWDAPTQLWQPQSHYNVQLLIHMSSSPAGETGSRIRRFGQHSR